MMNHSSNRINESSVSPKGEGNIGEDSIISNAKTTGRRADFNTINPTNVSVKGSKKNHIDLSKSTDVYS